VEAEVSAPCHTGLTGLMDVVHEHPIIHFAEDLPMGLSSGLAAVDFHGVEAEAESLVAGEGSVVGGSKL
jgi:hypothetical protein